ncbi:MAG: acyl-CoA/acyl-ACP dehydrogenase [Acidimicrobiia bacterium]|nr:acyl-CoA/acyl-ACP dehydrogenase [Acidimicrobiia bacterium]
MSDLEQARQIVDVAAEVVAAGVDALVSADIDEQQLLAYDVAHAASAVEACRSLLPYGARGPTEAALTSAYVADVVHDLADRTFGAEDRWGISDEALATTRAFVGQHRTAESLARFVSDPGPTHLSDDFALVAETFRRFADNEVAPHAEHVHRTNADVPEPIITGLAELGGFGLSIPEEYGGFADGSTNDYLGMVVATEELSRASLGIGGSLMTRPEILTRALVRGGTEAQKQAWLPPLARGEIMAAVAVTEPDYGSDVAAVRVSATPGPDGWRINGTKTWCTFAARADVLLLLARTEPGSTDHRGLTGFVVPKERGDGHGFVLTQPHGGRMEARPIDTIGYRGMHSYEIAFDDWLVPDDCQIGGDEGRGRGFYYQMEGFENGRLQTAARAVGVMQAAFEAARDYANDRVVFDRPIAEYQLTQSKLGRMAVMIQASRQFMYRVAELMADGEGMLEASMVKAYVCRAAEWVTREALQIHGGMGYAEEYAVSRYYVDARVLSIFEGADETLCLKVIARRLLADR